MKKFLALAFVLIASRANAQTASPSNHLGWFMAGQSAATAQGATYNAYVDAAVTPVVLLGVGCTTDTVTSTNADCVGDFPALVPGLHTIALTQLITGVESPKSNVLSFTFVVVSTPQGLKIVELQELYRILMHNS